MRRKIDWTIHFKRYEKSGLSAAEYCRKNQINIHSFRNARRRESAGRIMEIKIPEVGVPKNDPALECYFSLPFAFQFKLKLGKMVS